MRCGMSNNAMGVGKGAVAAPTAPVPISPDDLISQLRVLRDQIPNYQHLPVLDAKSIRRVAHVDVDFMQASFNAIGASNPVEAAVQESADELRQELDVAGRWTQVADELRSMLQGVEGANLDRRHRLGLVALLAYSISRALVRKKENSALLPHVAEMKRLNKFGRKRKTAATPAPQPSPTPSPTPESPAPAPTTPHA
jgi:hypothetical protein